MLHRKIIGFCYEVRAKYVNKAELYYTLISYRAVDTPRQDFKNQSLMLYGKQLRFVPRSIQNT
jgi:hypothetical protein